MRILHDSRDLTYRTPFGAVQLGGTVRLTVDVLDEPKAQATLRLWVEGKGETLLPMSATRRPEGLRFSAEIEPECAEIHWYHFIVDDGHGNVRFLGARQGSVGGVGEVYWSEPPSFQITVYRKRAVYPEWFENAIVYQIFPDRFFRGRTWETSVVRDLEKEWRGTRRRLVEDWNAPVSYERDETGDVVAWDFYGGTLNGITEKLDYLADLGITALYLNPIFEALSDHRYDTGDYLKVDPILGDEDDFKHLAMEAARRGISLILDGVFNHTGTDSVYFNAYGNYPTVGASQSADSPYHDWYLLNPDGTYASWWGVKNMPAMNKASEGWRDFVFGRDGVVETWLRRGARGWRLDVADELTDEFIARIKEAETREKPDALLLGEVWEDASHKVAYSEMRHYFCGEELDGVMNYPFRTSVLAWLRGEIGASEFAEAMEALHENYPPHAFLSSMNLLGSHDRARVLTMLGGAPDPDTLTDEEKRAWRIPDDQLGLAKSRYWLALLILMCWPGPPCIYYGDEAGLQGMTDPYNRGTFPWGHEDPDTMAMVRNAIDLRRSLPFLSTGGFHAFSHGDEVFGFWREGGDDCACILVNRSPYETAMVELPMRGEAATELVGGSRLALSADGERITLPVWPLGSAVVYFHPKERMSKALDWGTGVFCAITSVPNADGRPGTLGEPAKRFVDFLADAGQSYWQILPVNPTDATGSPYSGPSAFAANADLIDTGGKTLDEAVRDFRPDAGYVAFLEAEGEWLRPYAAYMAVRDLLTEERGGGHPGPWPEWPEAYRAYDPQLLERDELKDRIRHHQVVQYLFQRQWDELKRYAHERGIKIIGDMPIYVASDSADTWAHTELFSMLADGTQTELAGYPPDGETPQGQLWGNPTYDWEAMRADGYHWWLERMSRAFELYDEVRLDHFIGFERYWAIPMGKTPAEGRWRHGPGLDLFRAAYRRFGALPIIAEDLGDVTPAVRVLVETTGVPGMDIAIFADSDVRESYVPRLAKIAYTTTHDTTTLVGWVEERFYPNLRQTPTERARMMASTLEGKGPEGPDALREEAPNAPLDLALAKNDLAREARELTDTARSIERRVLESDAPVTIMPLQDVLLLDASARMNTPGTVGGNWTWQATEGELAGAVEGLRRLTEETGRMAGDAPRVQSPRLDA